MKAEITTTYGNVKMILSQNKYDNRLIDLVIAGNIYTLPLYDLEQAVSTFSRSQKFNV